MPFPLSFMPTVSVHPHRLHRNPDPPTKPIPRGQLFARLMARPCLDWSCSGGPLHRSGSFTLPSLRGHLTRSLTCLSFSRDVSAEGRRVKEMGGPLGAIIGRYPAAAGVDAEGQIGGGGGGNDGGIIRHNRKCRDLVFLVIFIAFWVAMIVNSSFGFNQGNPLR